MVYSFAFDKAQVEKLLSDGLMGGNEEIAEYERGGTPWCITYTFMPDELEQLLVKNGVKKCKTGWAGRICQNDSQ